MPEEWQLPENTPLKHQSINLKYTAYQIWVSHIPSTPRYQVKARDR